MIPEYGFDCKGREYQKIEIGKAKDLTNQKYNKLTVLFRVKILNKNYGKTVYWLCLCDCGNLFCSSGAHIVNGHNQGCGCIRKEQMSKLGESSRNDLTNYEYNKIKFLKFNPNYKQEHFISSKNAYWDCQCFCGKQFTAKASDILRNRIISCGCLNNGKSIGEKIIEDILISNKIKYIYDTGYFKDLIMPSGKIGRYDFILFNDKNQPYRIIEFDGRQHYDPNNFFDTTEEDFLKRQNHDYLKNLYALNHNIPLIRIPYSELKNLSIDLIMSNKYLITKP